MEPEVQRVFSLIITNREKPVVSEAALAQAIKATDLMSSEEDCRRLAAEVLDGRSEATVEDFDAALRASVDEYNKNRLPRGAAAKGGAQGMTVGSALLGVLNDLKKFYADKRMDFTLATRCMQVHEQLKVILVENSVSQQ